MSETRRLVLLQQAGLSADRDANVADLLERMASAAAEADLIVPTELSTTAYFAVLHDDAITDWAEKLDGELVGRVSELARAHRTTILLPLYLESGDKRENAVIVIGPDGERIDGRSADGSTQPYYSKTHLPDAWHKGRGLDEPYYFARGNHYPVFDTPIGKVGILICYDRRFPEAWRSLVFGGAELIFVPSCVPAWNPGAKASTGEMFVAELRTRAVENGVFVAACNRAGEQQLQDVSSTFVGQSCVIDPAGAVLAAAPADEAVDLVVDVDPTEVARIRRRLTIFRDRRPDTYLLDAEGEFAAGVKA